METIQFEGLKVALKQDKTGYVLTLSIHPDDVPNTLLRDFIGARYQVVMVRLDNNENPMDRQEEYAGDRAIRLAGLLSRDKKFWEYLYQDNQIFIKDEVTVADWIRDYLNVVSRSELKTNKQAQDLIDQLYREYTAWQPKT